ncbi:hypothetical protein D6745_01555 [Candidatus Woesearchaeota archaeon]|nr:MAG: hypothetical protein D6745_01555 [Candidatus Woesearchaeota archaeon]
MENLVYTDLNDPHESNPASYFLISSLLKERMSSFPSNSVIFDEDVNVYITGVLLDPMRSRNSGRFLQYVSPYDSDVFERIARSKSYRTRFDICRVNADFLLFMLGLFPEGVCGGDFLSKSFEAQVQRGKSYYQMAVNFGERTSVNPAVPEVMQKLSTYFKEYRDLLFDMRGDYLNLLERMTEHDFAALQESMDAIGEIDDLKKRIDANLEALTAAESTEEKRRITAGISRLSARIEELKRKYGLDQDNTLYH